MAARASAAQCDLALPVGKSQKRCPECRQTKPVSEFYRNIARAHAHCGLSPQCKVCTRARMRGQSPVITRRSNLKINYGLSLEQYDALAAAQDGRCAICRRTPEEIGRRLAVDHCHATRKIRGLLCHKCNLAIGALGDNAATVLAAYNYLAGGR